VVGNEAKSGGQGTVEKVKYKHGKDQFYGRKTISNMSKGMKFDGQTLTQTEGVDKTNVGQIDTAMDELLIGKQLDHENVLKVYSICIDKNFNAHILMEWADGGDLKTYIANNTNDINDDESVVNGKWLKNAIIKLTWCEEMGASVDHMHDKEIIHNDIKPQNFMLKYENGKLVVKLIDFGASVPMDSAIKRHVISNGYTSLEQRHKHKQTTMNDVYSLFVTIYEVMLGVKLFKNN